MLSIIGKKAIEAVNDLGDFGIFCLRVINTMLTRGFNVFSTIFQMAEIGVGSLKVVIVTGSAIGAILALHGYKALNTFGQADRFLGSLVYLSMTREFGCVIAAIMVIARAGSAMTAEIGSMTISEQIYALRTLSIDPYRYVVVPRTIATTLVVPVLNLFCILFGVGAGYLVATGMFNVNPEVYQESVRTNLVMKDVVIGLIKSFIFGFLLSLICTYKGMTTRGGARDLGQATTKAVVYACVTIFVADYILGALMFDYT